MTASEFAAAWQIARSDVDLTHFDDQPMAGLALNDFKPVEVQLEAVARWLRYHCCYIFGNGYDGEELERHRRLMVWPSRKVTILKTEEFVQSALATLLAG